MPDYTDCAAAYIRSTSVYNQFTLLARFDALWLSPNVINAYAHAWGCKHGLSDCQIHEYYHNELAAQEGKVTFYVLSLYEVPLDIDDPAWAIFLDIDTIHITPIEIKKIELPRDYALFFGKHCSRFKIPYQVTFDIQQNGLKLASTSCMKLIFRSTNKQAELSWNLDQFDTCSDTINM